MHYPYNLERSNKSVIQLNATYPTAAEQDFTYMMIAQLQQNAPTIKSDACKTYTVQDADIMSDYK